MIKTVLIVVALIGLVVALLGLWIWHMMGNPFYEPGMVRSGKGGLPSLDPPSQESNDEYWRVEDGIQLHYFAVGDGPPVLVVHGGPGMPFAEAMPALRSLENDYTFYYYDQRGAGKSTRPFDRFATGSYYNNMIELERTLGIGAQIADIERVRRLLGVERLTIIGHSFGAFLATLYACEFPERVEAMVLVAPANLLVLPNPDAGLFEAIAAHLPADYRREYEQFLKTYMDYGKLFSESEAVWAERNRTMGRYFLIAAGQEPGQEADKRSPTNGGWMVQAMYLSMGKRHDYRSALAAVTAPVLVVHGENDLIPLAASESYVKCLPNARLHVLRDAGHFTFQKLPDGFGEAVRGFLSEHRQQ
jgi:proline iminopeptidase